LLVLSVVLADAPRVAAPSGTLETVLTGLSFPTSFRFAPDGRIFLLERFSGKIRIVENGSLLPTPFYTLANVATNGEQGLLGLALDPDFPTEPWVYAYYTLNNSGTVYNRIVRIHANGDVGDALEVLLDHIGAGTIHNGGVIGFAPDKTLYAVVGENGDPAKSQDLLSLNGKVLRMDRNGTAPPGNPFAGQSDANPYVFTYGHRNMFGLAFHPVTGRAFITENGPECNDEVNLLVAGGNFGWGPHETCSTPPAPPNNTNQDGPNPILPITWYTPTVAPTNAIAYGGPNFTAWQGDLFFGEWNTGKLRRLDLEPPNYDTVVDEQDVLQVSSGIVAVEVGPDGAIWFTTPTTLYRFVDTSRPPIASFTVLPFRPLVNVTATFNASASRDPDGSIVTYAWDFGDGATDAGKVVTHAYELYGSYNVTLVLTDIDNLTTTMSRAVRVLSPPTAAFVVSPLSPDAGAIVSFDASSSSDADGMIVSFEWDFGDQSTGSGVTVTHVYGAEGSYLVSLVVTDSDGVPGTASRSLLVGSTNQPPVASFTATPDRVLPGDVVRFDASGSSDAEGPIVSYAWDFGDGGSAVGAVVSHVYSAKGTYIVTLTVEDTDGATTQRSAPVVVSNRAPVFQSVAPLGDDVTVPLGAASTFRVAAADPDGDPLTITWRLDGVVVAAGTASFLFPAAHAGVFRLNVTVSDGTDATWHEWTIRVGPQSGASGGLTPDLALGVVIAASVVAGLAGLLLRRRRRRAG